MRTLLLLLLGACGASIEVDDNNNRILDGGPSQADAPDVDPPIDAPRACAGGDAQVAVSDGSCLLRFNTARTFADAQAACVAIDAQLAVLTTAVRDAAARTLVGADIVYIGLSDQVTEDTFVWVDGTPLAFENFAADEPNNAGGAFEEDCAVYSGARAGWDDRPCAPIAGVQVPGAYPYLCMF